MRALIKHDSGDFEIDFSRPLDISIPLKGNESSVRA
jgi:hypothetical protein